MVTPKGETPKLILANPLPESTIAQVKSQIEAVFSTNN